MSRQGNMNEFEPYANQIIDKYSIPGTSIGISKNGQIDYYKGFGHRNIEKNLHVNEDTVFGIASVTKSFTCVAIMQLQEIGKLSVHDKIRTYLPEFQTPDQEKTEQMTIHHFMTNTSGLPPLSSFVYANKRSTDKDPSTKDHPGLKIQLDDNQGPIDTYEELMEFIRHLEIELLGPPGIHFSYSNDALALLGAIIARVSGKSYEDYVKENIIQPIEMINSYFDLNDIDNKENITMLYAAKETDEGKNVYPAPGWWDAPAMRAAGQLKSTVNDMLRYAEIFRNKGFVENTQILSEESVKQMTYPYIEMQPGKFYGYGLMITPDYYGHTLIEHSGNLKAIASLMTVVPELGISGMVLTNLAGVPAPTLLMAALNVYQEKDVEASHVYYEDYDMPLNDLKKYVGTYTSNEGTTITIGLADGKLTFYTQDSYYPIRSIEKDTFVVNIKDQEEVLSFFTDHLGNVDRIAYHLRQFPKNRLETLKN